jgi:Fe/S biogenesis protein NfuA
MERPSREQIKEFIAEEINPGLEMHGGFLTIEAYDEESGILNVTMGGGCQGCASANVTLKLMITHALKDKFPGIESVEDATDHALGQNPYY